MTIRLGQSGVQRPICDYRLLPVVFNRFVYTTDPVVLKEHH